MNAINYIHWMNIRTLDLNLLRLFDAIWRSGSVGAAAEELGLSQPAASQALGRLRRELGDALFMRAARGVTPTPRAMQLATAVQHALSTLENALAASQRFDPASARRTFRLHLSDIGEARFLPPLMGLLRRAAPGIQVESAPWPHAEIAPALDAGRIDLAIGYLPSVSDTLSRPLIRDRYVFLMRRGHPAAARWGRRPRVPLGELLGTMEFAAVRSHADTLRVLALLGLESRVRLTAANFLSLPVTVLDTDLAVLMPRTIVQQFAGGDEYAVIDPQPPLRELLVSMHWSRRFDQDPAQVWLREQIVELFPGAGAAAPADRAKSTAISRQPPRKRNSNA